MVEVFTERHVADVVEAVLDVPGAADPVLQVGGLGVGGGQGHGQVGGFPAGPAVDDAGAGDPDGLFGVRERDPAWRVQGDRFDGAGLAAAVAAVAGAVPGRDVGPRQALELRVQGRLVGLDLDEQVGVAGGDLPGVPGLGVQGIGDEDDVGQVAEHSCDGVEQWGECRDFVALRRDGELCQDDAGGGVEGGEQVDLAAVGAAGTAQGFAVDGDDGAVSARSGRRRSGAGAQPAGQNLGERSGVKAGQ
ncbi:hypothetical protein GCM10010170_021200 [Dactylosporangium salmoneum]|uniref:Uncharacterized protein n=1 Tax=Dactylosporangium salmoneum TaxID=53361 RepID=A0ABN3FWN4_9ACTN